MLTVFLIRFWILIAHFFYGEKLEFMSKCIYEDFHGLGFPVLRQQNGAVINQVPSITIADNRFENYKNGLQYYWYNNSAGVPITNISSCKFIDNQFGLVMADVEYPITAGSTSNNINNTLPLKIECNLFDGNNVGVIGHGLLQTQGSSTQSAGNRFQNAAFLDMNSEWAFLLRNDAGFMQYYRQSSTAFDNPKPDNGPGYWIDGMFKTTTSLSLFAGSTNSCTIALQRSNKIKSIQNNASNIEISNPIIYPNPSHGQFIVESNLDKDFGFITITDLSGKVIKNVNLVQKKTTIFCGELMPGMYVIKFSNSKSVFKISIL